MLDLQVHFIVTISDNRCRLPADVGPCRGNISRWYYDNQRGECIEFGWGGCEGNLNNFIDKETCLSSCSVRIIPVGPVDKEGNIIEFLFWSISYYYSSSSVNLIGSVMISILTSSVDDRVKPRTMILIFAVTCLPADLFRVVML